MKVKVKYKDCNKLNSSHDIIIKFIKHLQSKFPLKNDVSIVFLGEKLDGMTTGSRTDNSELRILVQNRDEANAYSGRLVKQFEKRNPYKKEVVYNSFE